VWLSFGAVDIGEELRDIKHLLRRIMAAVQIQQEDLDATADALTALVTAVREIDTTQLPDADKTRLQASLTDLTSAINEKLSPSTPVDPPAEGDV
jgi:ABC-type transporter Mla subunit MlaD